MLCRALLATIAISYLICVLFLSGIQKDDLEVALLKKLQHHNIDFNDPSLREECLNKTIRRSDSRSREELRQEAIISQGVTSTEKVTSTEHAIEKYSDELNITGLDLDSMVKYLSEATTITVETDRIITTDTNTKKDNILTMTEPKSSLDKNNTQIKNNALHPRLKLESLQNILKFWEEYTRRFKPTATPMNTTQTTVGNKTTSTTSSSVTKKQNHRNSETKQVDEVERISKIVAQYILSKNNSTSVENSTNDKEIPITTHAPLNSTSMNPREIEEKFALSLDAINKLNENIAILQNKFQSSVSNNNYDKTTEIVKTVSKLAKGVVIFPRDSVVGLAQNLENEASYNHEHQKTYLLQNQRYTAVKGPDHDCTSNNKFPSHISRPLFLESDYKNQINLNDYKQPPSLNLNADENNQEDAYRDPNRISFNVENHVYGNTKENTVSSLNHNIQNESLKTFDTNMLSNNPYLYPAYEESHGNVENFLDTPINNKYKIDMDRSHQKNLKHSASHNSPNLQNYFDYEKVSSNLKSNSPYDYLESFKNGSPQVSTFKVMQYPNENVFLNSQTPFGENENRYHKINQKQTSDDIGQNSKNMEEKTATFGRDMEQQIFDNFQNKEFQFKYKTITNNTSLQITPLEVLKYRYKNTISQTPIVQNNYSNLKKYQQHPQSENTVQKLKYFEEQTTFDPRGIKQSISEETIENYDGQSNQHKYKYTAKKIQADTVQKLSKDYLIHKQTLLTYKNENNSDKVSLPSDMLNQIAQSVKQIILKDLKNELNTSLNSSSTFSPLTSNSEKYKNSSKPESSTDTTTISIRTTTSTRPMPIVSSTTEYSALNQNQTKPEGKASTSRITNLTDSLLKQKLDRFQEATQVIENFLDLFKQYSTAAQEKTNSVDGKKKHPKLLPNSLTPVAEHSPTSINPPRLHAVNPYDMGLSPKPVFIHHYFAPQIPPPPVPTNLITGVPIVKPLQVSQQADLIHLPQPIMIQTNLNEIQPIRVPILNYDSMNIVVQTQTPYKNQEEKNRWNFMLKYGRNPDTRAKIQSTKQSLDAYSHVKSIQHSSPNYEIVQHQKAKHTENKTNDYTELNPYLKYIIEKLKVDKDKINHIIPRKDKYSEISKNKLDKGNYRPVHLHQNEKNIFENNYRGATEADTRYQFSNLNGPPNVGAQFASPNKDFSVINSNEYQRCNYRPTELQKREENIYENNPDTGRDTQYLLNNTNSTYYKNMAAQFAALDKDVTVINLNPGYINMIKGFGLNQNMKSAELYPNNSFYNEYKGVILNKEDVNSQNNKHKENYTQKDLRIYNDNMYKIYDTPKVGRNHYEDYTAINNRPKHSNQEFSGQYNEKYMDNHVQISNSMPTKNLASEILLPSDRGRINTDILPKSLAQSKYTREPNIFNNLNLHKNDYDPQLRYSSDSLNRLYLKKDSKNKFTNLERITDSPLQNKLLFTSPPTFKELILQNRLSHPTGRYYEQEESSKYGVNNKGQALISRGPFGTSLTFNNHRNRHGKTPWHSTNERNEKWLQHKARASAILGDNRYNSKNSNEGSHFDSDGNGRGPRYREYRTQVESSDDKPRFNKKSYYDTSDSDKRFGSMNIRGFHEKLEGSDDWRNSHGNIFSRQQVPLSGKHKDEDMPFKNFLKTQQKVNQMLEKILASKSEVLKSAEAI